jgi:hypothetical protein
VLDDGQDEQAVHSEDRAGMNSRPTRQHRTTAAPIANAETMMS